MKLNLALLLVFLGVVGSTFGAVVSRVIGVNIPQSESGYNSVCMPLWSRPADSSTPYKLDLQFKIVGDVSNEGFGVLLPWGEKLLLTSKNMVGENVAVTLHSNDEDFFGWSYDRFAEQQFTLQTDLGANVDSVELVVNIEETTLVSGNAPSGTCGVLIVDETLSEDPSDSNSDTLIYSETVSSGQHYDTLVYSAHAGKMILVIAIFALFGFLSLVFLTCSALCWLCRRSRRCEKTAATRLEQYMPPQTPSAPPQPQPQPQPQQMYYFGAPQQHQPFVVVQAQPQSQPQSHTPGQ